MWACAWTTWAGEPKPLLASDRGRKPSRKLPCEPVLGTEALSLLGCFHAGGARWCAGLTWQADVALLKSMGVQSYRFSIAWSRVLPGEGSENYGGSCEGSAASEVSAAAAVSAAPEVSAVSGVSAAGFPGQRDGAWMMLLQFGEILLRCHSSLRDETDEGSAATLWLAGVSMLRSVSCSFSVDPPAINSVS